MSSKMKGGGQEGVLTKMLDSRKVRQAVEDTANIRKKTSI
jgi:hypothetical protein